MLKLTAAGYVGKDPIYKEGKESGQGYALFSIADTKRGKDGADTTVWVSIMCYCSQPQANAFIKKGTFAVCQGDYSDSLFTPKNGGDLGISRTVFTKFNDCQFVNAKHDNGGSNFAPEPFPTAPATKGKGNIKPDNNDDVPF